MDTYNKDSATQAQPENQPSAGNRSGRAIAGLIVVAVGVIFFARRAGADIPRWIFSWEMLLIALGLFVGFKHSFKNYAWLVLIVIGSIFLAGRIFPYSDISHYAWPTVIIAIGLLMIFKSGKKNNDARWRKWDRWDGTSEENASDDYLDSTVIFGGVKKNIISKNFKGGDITTVFGGTDINFTQADVEGRIVLDITTIFGGNKLIVPPHWKIQSQDVVAIFGAVEDKRAPSDPSLVSQEKVLVLHGTCLFGGIDIKSF